MWPVIPDSPHGSSIYVLDIASATKIYSEPQRPTRGSRYRVCNPRMIKLDHDETAAKWSNFHYADGLGKR